MPPHAFLAWNGGALIVDSQIQACGWATSSALERLDEGPGTTFTAIAPDGTVTHPTLDLDPTFVAWSASSADASLALVGTIGIRHDGGSYVAGTRDVVVMRRSKSTGGRFVANVIARGEGQGLQSYRSRIRELGDAAVVLPAPARDDGTPQTDDSMALGGDEETWKGHASSIFLIEDGGVREVTVREPSEQDCAVRDAVRVGGDLFALVSCLTSSRIARVRKDGPRTSLAMPKLERTADGRVASATPGKSTLVCHPTSLSASASDLLVGATCGDDEHSIAVVLRQRHR